MTLLSILKSNKCNGNKDDKKCEKALKKYLKKKNLKHNSVMKKRKKHHKKHHEKEEKNLIYNKIIIGSEKSIAEQMKKYESNKPTPRAQPTAQNVPSELSRSVLYNQRIKFEKKLHDQADEFKREFEIHKVRHSESDSFNDGLICDSEGDICLRRDPVTGKCTSCGYKPAGRPTMTEAERKAAKKEREQARQRAGAGVSGTLRRNRLIGGGSTVDDAYIRSGSLDPQKED